MKLILTALTITLFFIPELALAGPHDGDPYDYEYQKGDLGRTLFIAVAMIVGLSIAHHKGGR